MNSLATSQTGEQPRSENYMKAPLTAHGETDILSGKKKEAAFARGETMGNGE